MVSGQHALQSGNSYGISYRVDVTHLGRHVLGSADSDRLKGNRHPAYRADIVGETRKALAAWTQDPAAKSLYDNFVAAMVYGEPVAFSAAIGTLTGLVELAWPGATSIGQSEFKA
jgi:hypothetical protein